MSRDSSRYANIVEVPDVVGLHVRDAARVAHVAGLKLAQPDPDGPPMTALTWPDDYWITEQQPPAGSSSRRWDPLVVHWSASPGQAGVREPRRPSAPIGTLTGEIDPSTNR
ncbi:PASTA domain-containing protein [Flexivirga lutea]